MRGYEGNTNQLGSLRRAVSLRCAALAVSFWHQSYLLGCASCRRDRMGDWVDRNFEALCRDGFLKREHGGSYSITEKGAAQAVSVLDVAGCLNLHAFHAEQAPAILQQAAERWLARGSRQRKPGTKNHILIDCFREALG
jgi:hypothetical protein